MPGSISLFQSGSPRDIELLEAKTTKEQTIRNRTDSAFIEPMQCKPVTVLPEGKKWTFEIKFDGYRCIAVKRAREVALFSRHKKVLNKSFPSVVEELAALKDDFVLDGELVALDSQGRPSFQLLQNNLSRPLPTYCYVFDLLNINGQLLTNLPFSRRRELLESLLAVPKDPLHLSPLLQAPSGQIILAVRKLGLEGIVEKRINSKYEPGERSGAWIRLRTNLEQEFVIGGCIPGARGLNLPEKRASRWGESLTAEKMSQCRWINPKLVCQVAFVEWTDAGHLRHCIFVGMRDDKEPAEVVRET